jgi:hypothetical protein
MLHPSTKRLIDKLDEMTRRQRVAWEENDNGSVTHDTEGYRVTLTAPPHTLLLTDTLGREIETCTPDDFSGETDASGRPYMDFVEDLYREAHRHARGAEKAISALLSALDQAASEVPDKVETAPETFEHVEDEGDDSRPLEEHEMPEYEGQADMQAAVAAMADEVNGPPETNVAAVDAPEPEPEPEPQPAFESAAAPVFTPMPEPEAPLPEPDVQLDPAAAAPEPEAPADPYAPFEGSEESARVYATAAEFVAPAAPEPFAETSPAEAEPEPFSSEETVWDTIRNAGHTAPEAAPEPEPPELAEPEAMAQPAEDAWHTPEPEPQPPEAPAEPAPRPAPVFGSGMFSGSMGDLSRYRSAPPAAPAEPEPQPVAEPAALAPEPTPEPPPLPDPEPAPEPPQHFSLSGITSGFGLSSTLQPATRTQPAEPVPPSTAPTEPRKIIDGTIDLPDALPEYAPEPLPEPVQEMDLRMEEDEEFGFTDADLMPGIPAEPLPAVFKSSASEPPHVEKSATQETDSEDGPPPKPARRFNPWN